MKLSRLVVPAALGLVGLSLTARDAHADLLTFFDFNSNSLNSTSGPRSSTITTNFTSDGLATNGNTGTTINNDPDDQGPFPASAAGSALAIYNTNETGATSNAGRYIQFRINTTGYRQIFVDFATAQGTVNTTFDGTAGFNNNQFQYSFDGTTFTNFSVPYNPANTYALRTYDFSNINGLNNNANAAFRIVFNGGPTDDFNASNLIDNLAINATALPTPEPSTYAMMALGLVALCVLGAKRKKDGQAL